MPTITVRLHDLLDLVGEPVADTEFADLLDLAKAELHRNDGGTAAIEVRDNGRPDLWCAEGIARQIGTHLRGAPRRYRCFALACPAGEIHVPAGAEPPFAGAFVCEDAALSEWQRGRLDDLLRRLGEDFGRRRLCLGCHDEPGGVLRVTAGGTMLRPLLASLNVVAANLEDRGGTIRPILTRYERPTELGADVPAPFDLAAAGLLDVVLRPDDVLRTLGSEIPPAELCALLRAAGYDVAQDACGLRVRPAPYRLDVLQPVDVLEDAAIGRGMEAFELPPPDGFAIGRLAPETALSDRFRDAAVGLGFDEVLSHALLSREDLTRRMGWACERGLVRVANPLGPAQEAVRDALLPGLLAVEATSTEARYPHRLFEVGETLRWGGGRVETRLHAAFLVAHAGASRAELSLALEAMADWFRTPVRIVAEPHPPYRPDRSASIHAGGQPAGTIGELGADVLARWGIEVPCAAMELDLDALAVRDAAGRPW